MGINKKIMSLMLSISMLSTVLPAKVFAEQAGTNSPGLFKENVKKDVEILGELTEKRGKNIREFFMDDMSYEAEIYSTAVNYYDNGVWKEIDNTLADETDEDNNSVLSNKENDFKIKFSKNSEADKLVKILKDKYELSWKLEDTQKSDGTVESINQDETTNLSENEQKKAAKNISSGISYTNILPDINLEYKLNGDIVKENIVINKQTDKTDFTFNLNVKNLIPKLQDDNSIVFYDAQQADKAVFVMKAPYMYDSKNNISDKIKISLTQVKEDYVLNLNVDKDWLSSTERVYPVTIDPDVYTSQDVNSIKDTFVASNDSSDKYNNLFLRVGQTPSIGTTRSFLKFDLPTITSGDMITNAQLNLCSEAAYSGNGGAQVNAHDVTSSWGGTTAQGIYWSNQPSYNSTIKDYATVNSTTSAWYAWNVTDIVKKWYTSGNNNGLMLKADNECSGYVSFLSSDCGDSYINERPVVSIEYISNVGLENYWTYHSQSAGRAGTGYTNDYNGDLVFIHDDLDMNGNKLPVNITHVYNSNNLNAWDKAKAWMGRGWMLNIFQRVDRQQIGSTWYWVFTDEDGTKHYFKDDGSTELQDELNLGFTFIKESDGSYTVKDKNDNKARFYWDGYLLELKDRNGNTITPTYERAINTGAWIITSVIDSANRKVTLQYDNSGLLTHIIDPAQRSISFEYDNSTYEVLKKITYPDLKYTTF